MSAAVLSILDFLEVLEAVTSEDLVEVRDKLALIEEEFALMVADHHKHVAALRHLETILAFRLGEVAPVAKANLEPPVAAPPAEPTFESDVGNVALVDPTKPGWPFVDSTGEAIAEDEASEAADSQEVAVDEPEQVDEVDDFSDDENRSIEQRIREKLLKLGSRSARQLGAMLGIEKAVVFAALSESNWFKVLPGSKGSHSLHWMLTPAGERGD